MIQIIVRRVVLLLALAFVAIQFWPMPRTNPESVRSLEVPPELEPILKGACYDCHSNNTRWPWYSRVAPVSWWVVGHVNEGREHLNFSDWPEADSKKARHQFHEIDEVLREGEMPLPRYDWLHRDAVLTDEEIQAIRTWAKERS